MNIVVIGMIQERGYLKPSFLRKQEFKGVKRLDSPRIKYGAGLVKPGMANKGKTFPNHYH